MVSAEARRCQIARAIRDRAVADIEQPFQFALCRSRARFQAVVQQPGQELQAFQAAANHHQSPTIVLSHIVHRKARQPRERQQQGIEYFARITFEMRALFEFTLQHADGAPILAGELTARLRGAPGEALQIRLHAKRVGVVECGHHRRGRLGDRELRASFERLRPEQRIGAHVQGCPQEPRLVFAALAVASEPEQVFRQARGQIVMSCGNAFRGAGNIRIIGLAAIRRQHPDILAAAAALHRNDVGGVRSNACQSPGHHAVPRRRRHGIHADPQGACGKSMHLRASPAAARASPNRCLREGQALLGHVGVRPGVEPLDQLIAL